MNRLCNIIMVVSALAVILSTMIVAIRSRRILNNGPNPNAMLLHKVFVGSYDCEGDDYFSYKSPFSECYNPNSYDETIYNDVYDEILTWERNGRPTSYQRTYYYSTDGSCQNKIDNIGEVISLWGFPCTSWSNGVDDNGNYVDAGATEESLTYRDA